jgi:hypothetical protein
MRIIEMHAGGGGGGGGGGVLRWASALYLWESGFDSRTHDALMWRVSIALPEVVRFLLFSGTPVFSLWSDTSW